MRYLNVLCFMFTTLAISFLIPGAIGFTAAALFFGSVAILIGTALFDVFDWIATSK